MIYVWNFYLFRSKSIALNRWCGEVIHRYGILLRKAVTICLVANLLTCPNNSWRKVTICLAYSHTIQILTATILIVTYCNHRSWVPQNVFNILRAITCQSNCSSQPKTIAHHHQMPATRTLHQKYESLCAVAVAL